MKKILCLLLIGIMLTCSGCSNKKIASWNYGEVIEIEMSDNTKEFLSEVANNKIKPLLTEAAFPSVMKNLEERTGLGWPSVETENVEEKITYKSGEVYTLTKEGYDCIVLYIHGGAYVMEATDRHVIFCDLLASELNAKVYMPNYPLAPQATYKDAYELLDEVYAELLETNLPIYIMGDSAGGGLALAYTEYIIGRGFEAPDKQVLISPWVDVSLSNSDIEALKEVDLILDTYGAIEFGKLWAGDDSEVKNPLVSPLYGDMKNMPDTLMFVGTDEIVFPDDMLVYDKMVSNGVNVVVAKGNGFWHIFPTFPIEEQELCIDLIKQHIEK